MCAIQSRISNKNRCIDNTFVEYLKKRQTNQILKNSLIVKDILLKSFLFMEIAGCTVLLADCKNSSYFLLLGTQLSINCSFNSNYIKKYKPESSCMHSSQNIRH